MTSSRHTLTEIIGGSKRNRKISKSLANIEIPPQRNEKRLFSHLDSIIIQKKKEIQEGKVQQAERVMRSSIVLDDLMSDRKRDSSPSDIGSSSSEEANFNHLLDEEQHSSQPIAPQSFKIPTYDD